MKICRDSRLHVEAVLVELVVLEVVRPAVVDGVALAHDGLVRLPLELLRVHVRLCSLGC